VHQYSAPFRQGLRYILICTVVIQTVQRSPRQLIGPFRRSRAPVFGPLPTGPTIHPYMYSSYTDSAAVTTTADGPFRLIRAPVFGPLPTGPTTQIFKVIQTV
jgi:hypothetical protein